MPTAGQRPNDNPVGGIEFVDDGARNVTQPASDSMSLHRAANRFRDHQTDPRAGLCVVIGPQCVHDDVGLHRPHPLTDRGTEFC